MKTSENTVLITGGSAGIGLEIARLFAENNNQVIITGRNKKRLEQAASELTNVIPVNSDVTNADDVASLVQMMYQEFTTLNIVVNNAARAMVYDLASGEGNGFKNASEEMFTNYLSVVRLNERLLPLLGKQKASAIVNVSSIAAFIPGSLVGYAASKAALHSYSNSLRMALEGSPLKVFELIPPLVNTEFSKEIGGRFGISPKIVAEEFFRGLENDTYEIRVGQAEQLYRLFLSSPEEALNLLKSQRKQLQATK